MRSCRRQGLCYINQNWPAGVSLPIMRLGKIDFGQLETRRRGCNHSRSSSSPAGMDSLASWSWWWGVDGNNTFKRPSAEGKRSRQPCVTRGILYCHTWTSLASLQRLSQSIAPVSVQIRDTSHPSPRTFPANSQLSRSRVQNPDTSNDPEHRTKIRCCNS